MDRLTSTTKFIDAKTDIRDRISVEVGDSKTVGEFLPQVKVCRWGTGNNGDNEVNLSVRLVHDETRVTVEEVGGLVKWRGERREAHFYELPASELLPEGGTEVEILLLERPLTNVVRFTLNTKGLAFYEQPALTQFEIDEGATRPPHVVGSYAVYADTSKTNYVGGKLYRSGKVGHIYRPWIVDANGNGVWGNLNIDTVRGLLAVRIPQAFLDSAAYPVRHAAGLTFGYSTIGGSTSSGLCFWNGSVSRQVGHKATPASGGEIDSVTYYVVAISGSANTKAMVWLGSDGTVVTNGVSPVVVVDTTPQWQTATYSSKPTITAQAYFLGYVHDSTNLTSYYDTETNGGNLHAASGDFYTTPTTIGSNGGTNYKISAYATYTEAAGGGIPRGPFSKPFRGPFGGSIGW